MLHCGKHYHNTCPNDIRKYNLETVQKIKNNEIIYEHKKLCGKEAVHLFTEIAKKKNWISTEYKYTSSDEITGDTSSSVGYASILFVESQQGGNLDLLSIPRAIMEWQPVREELGREM